MEVPKLNALHLKYQKQGLVVIGICASAGRKELKAFTQKNEAHYPIAVDVKNQTIENYKVDGYHDYYILDRFGSLRIADCNDEKIEEMVVALLSEKE